MNIEQKLEVIRKALEMGAEVELLFYGNSDTSKNQALENLGKVLGNTKFFRVEQGVNSFKAIDEGIKILQFWKESFMIEDINFEGVEEHA